MVIGTLWYLKIFQQRTKEHLYPLYVCSMQEWQKQQTATERQVGMTMTLQGFL